MKTSVGLTNDTVSLISTEVARLYRTKNNVKRRMTTNSMMAELALKHFFTLPEDARDLALEETYRESEVHTVEPT